MFIFGKPPLVAALERAAKGSLFRDPDKLAAVVLREGALFGPKRISIRYETEPDPFEEDFGMFRLGNCYADAFGLLEQREGEVQYCEGYAKAKGFPMALHGWCVDRDGAVIDSTWPEDLVRSADYYGMAFDIGYVGRSAFKNNAIGILPVLGCKFDRAGLLAQPLAA